jgi:transglutaminase-like putative cysteine protease
MTTIQVGCNLTYSVTKPTNFLFNIAVARTEHQILREETLQLIPDIKFEASSVVENQVHRIYVEPCDLQLQYFAKVELHPELYDTSKINETLYAQLPNEVLTYLNPSRYCESDRLSRFALQLFGNVAPGFSRVTAICDWINNNLDYQAGSSGGSTSACDVLIDRVGVCRDYAHLAIALCRALCIPARYISGYAVGLQPPDFHGFFEAYLGSRWYLFDATRMAPVEGFVRIGTGRDNAYASFATIIGEAELTYISVWVEQMTHNSITDETPEQSFWFSRN